MSDGQVCISQPGATGRGPGHGHTDGICEGEDCPTCGK